MKQIAEGESTPETNRDISSLPRFLRTRRWRMSTGNDARNDSSPTSRHFKMQRTETRATGSISHGRNPAAEVKFHCFYRQREEDSSFERNLLYDVTS